ncbi:MAG TPA: DUF3052 domain-containing protein [Thermoanaerobaculia bacterium]|nr:DUF3052 domain-containing protein [Thermoanaerobaculia bacterium]
MPGYSGTPLVAKLGIQEGVEAHLAGAPENYLDLVAPLPEGVTFAKSPSAKTGFVHHFTTQATELGQALAAYRKKLGPEAIVWVSWPKKSAKVPTDITEDTIRELALPLGWVDVKVCAVTEVWSGLKLVVRKALR